MTLTPPQEVALLTAWKVGIEEALTGAKKRLVAYKKQLQIKGGFETPWADISFAKTAETIAYDPDGLLEWAQRTLPHQVKPEHTVTVPAEVYPTIYETLKKRLKIDGDKVVDTETGEILDFAIVKPPSPEVRVTLPDERKREAAAYVTARVGQLTAALTDGSQP